MAVEIVMPRLSDSMEEGTILQWFVAEGDEVKEGEALVEVETDKASVTYESEHDGTVLSVNVATGASAAVGAVIAVIGEPGEPGEPGAPGGAARVRAARRSDVPGRVKASPVARRIAGELGVDLPTLVGSGPQGRVTRADVERSVSATTPAGTGAEDRDAAAAPAEVSAGPAPTPPSARGETSVQQLTRSQETIARRMAESRATVPDFELRCEVDMSLAVALREQLREQLREIFDPPPSYNDFIIKAAALALREYPRVNGSYVDAAFQRYSRVNVGVAVAAEDALVVPTIFDADTKSLAEIGATARELAARVRDGSISPSDLGGGTFSISNLGMYGLDSFSAVINPPQASILAVGSLKPRAVVDETGAVVARPTINLTLACDHRILYGADGARFLARLRELLEKPISLLV